MLPAGTVNTQIISQFEEAGINQTNHRIYLKIVCTVTGLIPGYPVNVEVENEFCLAETVVVGRVPESYTHVISDDSELISRLNDYGAQEQAVK
ncbi:MAG: sporulation protein YunB [Oscillospiraceae bacterium]